MMTRRYSRSEILEAITACDEVYASIDVFKVGDYVRVGKAVARELIARRMHASVPTVKATVTHKGQKVWLEPELDRSKILACYETVKLHNLIKENL